MLNFKNDFFVTCDNNYIMAKDTYTWKDFTKYMKHCNQETTYIDGIVFKPKTSEIRITIVSQPDDSYGDNFYTLNVSKPPAKVLKKLWDIDSIELCSAIKQFISQSDLKHNYKKLPEAERNWITTILLGEKRD